MLIEIESAYGDRLVHGKWVSLVQLKAAVNDIYAEAGEADFVAAFCARLGYEEIPCADVKVDYVIDTDTHRVFQPK